MQNIEYQYYTKYTKSPFQYRKKTKSPNYDIYIILYLLTPLTKEILFKRKI